MELITFIAGAALATGIAYTTNKKKEKNQVKETDKPAQPKVVSLPSGIGLHTITQADRIERKLEQAMDAAYFNAVKERILRKNLLTEEEYDVYLLELKRYFVLTTMMKSVPMYNDKVDIIWHEMLMFTKSYDAFCAQFMGSKIHHEPNLTPKPNKEEKGLFDFVYSYFFQTHKATHTIYPDLQKQTLSKAFIALLETQQTESIISTYFAPTGDEQYQALRVMITTLKRDIERAKKLKNRPSYLVTKPTHQSNDAYYSSSELLVHQMVWHSMIDFPEEKTVASTSRSHEDHSTSSKSSCSGSSCSSSSCSSSSCGSSCSS